MHSLMSIFNSINNPLNLTPRQLQLIDRLSTEESRLATTMGTFVFSHRAKPYTQLYDGKDVRLLSPKLHQLDRLPACMGTLRDQQKTVEAMHLCLAYAKANGQNFADLSSWIAKYSGNGTAQLAFSDNGTFKESVYEATLRSLVAHLYAERTMPQNAPLTAVDRLAMSTEQTYASLTDEKGKYTLGSYLVMLRTLMSIILGRNTDPASLDFLFHMMDERNRLIHTRNVPPQPVEVVMEYYVLALFVMTMLTLQMANARATEGAVVSASEPDVELGVAATGKTFSLKTPNAIFGLQLPQGGNTLTATDSNGQRIARTVNAADSNFMLPQNWVKFDFGTTTAPSQQPVPTAGKSTATPPATAAPTMTDMERKTQMVNALKDGGNAFERKKYDEALEHFVQADKLLPSSLTKALIGSALYHLGNTKEAQKYLSQATLTRWGQHTAPHAHLLRAYMNLEDCKKRFQKTGKDEEWDPVRLDMAAFKQLDTKENPCVQLMPTKQLKRWFQQVPDCKEPRDLAATINDEMNIAAKGLSDSQKRRKLEQLAKAKQEEATKGEVINLLIVVLTMAVTMACLWPWTKQSPWWTVGGCAVLGLIMSWLTLSVAGNAGGRPTPSKVTERNGQLCIRGITSFTPFHVGILALLWAGVPLVISRLFSTWLELPDTCAFYAAVRLAGRVMWPAAIVLAALALTNAALRFYEMANGPISYNPRLDKLLRPMLPCMRSDIPNARALIGDFIGKMVFFVVIAFITAALWLVFTGIVDKEMSQQKYHYWPWRPSVEVPADSAVVIRDQLLQHIEQMQQRLNGLPSPASAGLSSQQPKASGSRSSRGSSASPTPAKPKQVNVTSMSFENSGTVYMQMGSTYQLQLKVEPEDYNEVLSVSVAKNVDGLDVVSVSPELVVTPIRQGKVLIQVTSNRTHHEAHCYIDVTCR